MRFELPTYAQAAIEGNRYDGKATLPLVHPER